MANPPLVTRGLPFHTEGRSLLLLLRIRVSPATSSIMPDLFSAPPIHLALVLFSSIVLYLHYDTAASPVLFFHDGGAPPHCPEVNTHPCPSLLLVNGGTPLHTLPDGRPLFLISLKCPPVVRLWYCMCVCFHLPFRPSSLLHRGLVQVAIPLPTSLDSISFCCNVRVLFHSHLTGFFQPDRRHTGF